MLYNVVNVYQRHKQRKKDKYPIAEVTEYSRKAITKYK